MNGPAVCSVRPLGMRNDYYPRQTFDVSGDTPVGHFRISRELPGNYEYEARAWKSPSAFTQTKYGRHLADCGPGHMEKEAAFVVSHQQPQRQQQASAVVVGRDMGRRPFDLSLDAQAEVVLRNDRRARLATAWRGPQVTRSLDDMAAGQTLAQYGGAGVHVAFRRALSDHHVICQTKDFVWEEENGMMKETERHGEDLLPMSSYYDYNTHNSMDNGLPASPPNMASAKPSPALVGAAKRKAKSSMDSPSPASSQNQQQQQQQQQQQNLLMMAAQQGMTQQQLQGLPPPLQQMMQQQTLALQQAQHQKLHEQLLHGLNDQLQMNMMHQSQLLKESGKNKSGSSSNANHPTLQALLMQHQQIMQQIQLVQRNLALSNVLQPFGMPQGMMSPAELQQLWKEVSLQSGLDENLLKSMNGLTSNASGLGNSSSSSSSGSNSNMSNLTTSASNGHGPGLPGTPSLYLNGHLEGMGLPGMKSDTPGPESISTPTGGKEAVANGNDNVPHPLYINKCCKWPNCESHIEDYVSFIKHLNTEHQLDDRSTAQSRVQMEVVSSLESQLAFQKKILKAMSEHLHTQTPQPPPPHSLTPHPSAQLSVSTPGPIPSLPLPSLPTQQLSPKSHHDIKPDLLNPMIPKHLLSAFPSPAFMGHPLPMMPLPPSHRPPPLVSVAPSSSSLPTTPTSGGPSSSSDRGGPVRRRVSDKCSLPISAEIQRNREFYKNTDVRPPFTYASLIRQAIIESPHRQLTLNEIYQWFQTTFAYFRRNEATWKNAVRHNLSLHKCFMRVENVKGAVWTVDEIEFYKRRPQKITSGSGNSKSSYASDSAAFNDSISASLQAGLADGSLGLAAAGMMVDQESAEDLSMKATPPEMFGHGPHGRMDEAELMMRIKQEVQDVYPELYFGASSRRPQEMDQHAELGRRHTPSPSQDDSDVQGVEVKGGQMVMMPDMIERYEEEEEEEEEDEMGEIRRMEAEEEVLRMRAEQMKDEEDEMVGADEDAEMNDEERYRERNEMREKMTEEEMAIVEARARAEAEAERELRAVKEKFEREQAEEMRAEMESKYRSSMLPSAPSPSSSNKHSTSGSNGNVCNMASPPSTFSSHFTALNAQEGDENPMGGRHQQDAKPHENHFLSEHQSAEDLARRYDERGHHSSRVESPSLLNSRYGKGAAARSSSPYEGSPTPPDESIEEPASSNKEQCSRPFVVQLPDSGPVFPTPHRQSLGSSHSPPVDTAISSAS